MVESAAAAHLGRTRGQEDTMRAGRSTARKVLTTLGVVAATASAIAILLAIALAAWLDTVDLTGWYLDITIG
jgi:hypothetical protein